MRQKLLFTLKAWPVITALTVCLCWMTGFLADALFGISLDEQAGLAQVREYITALVRRLCAGEGLKWMFFSDAFALLKILLYLTVLVPAVEEAVFRWILYRLPRPALSIVPAVTSSILFSAAHYIQMPWPNNAFLALFFFGMAQCWLYKKTDALWCPIMNHGLFNATNLVLIFIIPQ